MGLKTLIRELASIINLFSKKNREFRTIVFYSEGSIYYLYFEGIINYILDNSGYNICYITSDPNDPVFEIQSDRFSVFYISNLMLAFVTIFLDSKVLVFTMTDLGHFHIKRSTKNVNHIYVFHAILSTHMVYRLGAFNHYDTIFCVGPHHIEEIKQTEKYYGLKKKHLVKVGYHLLEKINAEHREFKQKYLSNDNSPKLVLIAPSWNMGNIIETCIDDLVPILIASGYKVVLRPHPEAIKRNKRKLQKIIDTYGKENNFQIEASLSSVKNFYMAEVLITDWSGIAFEYAFGTERPALFINTPRKVNNNEFEKIGIEPIEVKLRGKIGITLDIEEIKNINLAIIKLFRNSLQYSKSIIELRNKFIYNWERSADVGGEYILKYLDNKI